MFVVGATRPAMLKQVREEAPHAFLLVPGVGAQGGTVEDVARFGMNDHCGLLVNSSRGILYAAGPDATQEESQAAAANVAEDLAAQMRASLEAKGLV